LTRTLHIISHDVPYPLDYGGVIDIFCTIRALHESGIRVILHCFDYGRGEQAELNRYCSEVHYYTRQEGHKGFSFKLPYIVSSRANCALLERLLQDDFPILIEGIHCTYLLNDERFRKRKMALRLFNVESCYYQHLYRHERSLIKKAYYLNESRLLKDYESRIAGTIPVLTLSDRDRNIYREKFHAKSVHTVQAFLPYEEVRSNEGIGSFCLYHGNLEVAENEKAAIWLLQEIFLKLKIPFVIAGRNPSSRLERITGLGCHTCLVSNPEDRELNDLISKAQINILPSFNETGVKLKLLNALFNGRHCIVNDQAVDGTPLAPLCHIAESPHAIQRVVQQLYHLPFGEEEIRLRKKILHDHFDNMRNAQTLISYLY